MANIIESEPRPNPEDNQDARDGRRALCLTSQRSFMVNFLCMFMLLTELPAVGLLLMYCYFISSITLTLGVYLVEEN